MDCPPLRWLSAYATVPALGATVEFRPHQQRNQLAAGFICALLGAATTLIVLLAIQAPQTPPAFPGWQAVPGFFDQSGVRTALSTCGVSPGSGPSRIGRRVATETRGPYAMAVYTDSFGQSVNSTWCLASNPQLFGENGWQNGTWSGGTWCTSSNLALKRTVSVGNIERRYALQTCNLDGPGGFGLATVARGRIGHGVTGVAIEVGGRRLVQATIDRGWFLAWWPGDVSSTVAEVTRADGRKSFTRLTDA